MLCYLIHTSIATFDNVHETLLDIDNVAHAQNPKHGITGLLLYDNGLFFQILEGEEKEVDTLYGNVKRDSRNTNVVLITKQQLEKRNFPNWTMKLKDISNVQNFELSVPPQNKDLSLMTPTYITALSNLLMGALKEDYKEIKVSQHLKSIPSHSPLQLFQHLSLREKQVLQLLVKGYTAKKIGRILNISDKTAARHTENMCKKLHLLNKNDLITAVFSSGYLNEILTVHLD